MNDERDERDERDQPREASFEWPDDGAPPDEVELQRARAHAERVERVLGGGSAEDDELASLAGMIHRSSHEAALGSARRARLLDDVLAKGSAPRERRRGVMSLLALAAALLLAVGVALSVGLKGGSRAPSRRVVVAPRPLPPRMLSRSSDSLLGRPIVDREAASSRIDRVYASRLAGYRALRMHNWRSP